MAKRPITAAFEARKRITKRQAGAFMGNLGRGGYIATAVMRLATGVAVYAIVRFYN